VQVSRNNPGLKKCKNVSYINADAWKTMPAELKVACGCGEVRTPKK
jgi:hypothetical protein